MNQLNHHGRLYSGDLWVRAYGTTDTWQMLGNVTHFSTKSDIEKKELIGRGLKNYGQAIDTVIIPKPTELEIKFDSFDKNALARALMGTIKEVDKQTTITDQEVKARLNGFFELGVGGLDETSFVLKNKSKTVIDKDKYELNANLGLVKLLDQKGISEGDSLYFDGKTKQGFAIYAGSLHNISLEIKLDGQDRVTRRRGHLHVPHAVLSASGDINWLSDDWWEAGLSGTIVKTDGKPIMTFTEFS